MKSTSEVDDGYGGKNKLEARCAEYRGKSLAKEEFGGTNFEFELMKNGENYSLWLLEFTEGLTDGEGQEQPDVIAHLLATYLYRECGSEAESRA